MIKLEKLNGRPFFLNEAFIETIEETPDTIILLKNGHKYIVKDDIKDVIELIKKEVG